MINITSSTITPEVSELLSYATSEAKIVNIYEKYVKFSDHVLYGFQYGKLIVGCIGIKLLGRDKIEIAHIAVSPNVRGNRIGSKMIEFICNEHSPRILYAETDNDAVDFYKKFGFKITNLGEKYPGVERFLCEYEITQQKGTILK
ncbi:GNAT family N-acetyltransferase [Bacillus pseudomycoides]|uniref:GNAT family N-acetyltransferase n=1 Tax=Bacillus pseudomycoides TaxID=64104 RepID=UPI000BEBF161|nr:GNAT family N-acetyltransferase [Bacillus pseudomycoides]MED4654549.1 GNAT family N-acetyltransferase [Bacillus pseudomycoides]PEE06066.1 GNAT family N-acetyltransferase [Bacillus pseudomycoides]PEM79699.1 GNAT family N-acetyltransferase [Bacillus pseudomycoides]PHC84393.1 GNAT family N-acetyltransferase [Bacillus pseudomycoides]